MKKTIATLSALLILQLGAALALRLDRADHQAFQARAPLLTFTASAVDRITISDGGGASVTLSRKEGAWQLPALDGFPADATAVERLLGKLAALKQGWPVATTPAAAQRFKVAGDDFERHIVLAHGQDTVAELYVGTSPGLRKVHVRRPDQQAIYAVNFNAFDAPPKNDDWIDKRVAQVKLDDIRRIELPNLTLVHDQDGWRLPDLGADETMASEEAANLAGQVSTLTISAVKKEAAPSAEPLLEYTLVTQSGERLSFRFHKSDNGYLLKTSLRPEYLQVPAFYVDNIKDSRRDKLVLKKASEHGKPAS